GHTDDGSVRVDYAFASYNFLSEPQGTFGVRLGHLRTPHGFYNETRDAAHTRSSILLPQSIYFDRLRDVVFARDGAQLFGTYRHGVQTFQWDLAYTKARIEKKYAAEVLGYDARLRGDIESSFSPVARLLWDWDMGRVRLGLTYQAPRVEYEATATDML